MKNIIIGAGPAGLYTAIELHKAGVRHLVMYDSRAGKYTRPGHVTQRTYIHATAHIVGAGFDLDKRYHIKDIERTLYAEAQRLGILIETKEFLRLHQDEKTPGIIVADPDTNIESMVPAKYVFDCSGGKRAVIFAVNAVVAEAPFKLNDMADLPVKNHLLAYVKMSHTDLARLNTAAKAPDTIDPTDYANAILALRDLGWTEFKFPRCYGAPFGAEKACIYLHAPDHLAPAHYEQWMQAVLACYAQGIHYEQVKPSKKYTFKPRFATFLMQAQALDNVSYQGDRLPTIVALGDVQIDFDYALGHGILDGMRRIDKLMNHIEVLDGHIAYFDSNEYLSYIAKEMRTHKRAVQQEAVEVKRSFVDALDQAHVKLMDPLLQSKNTQLEPVLRELNARRSYHPHISHQGRENF